MRAAGAFQGLGGLSRAQGGQLSPRFIVEGVTCKAAEGVSVSLGPGLCQDLPGWESYRDLA